MSSDIAIPRDRQEIQTAERLARIEERLESLPRLEKRIMELCDELRKQYDELEKHVRQRELHCVMQTGIVAQHSTKIDELNKNWKEIQEILPDLKRLAKVSVALVVMAGVGTFLGSIALGLLWKIATGEVELVFP